ncbi:MAG: hypothetical protein ACI4AM_05930 [Muribaculaceae bacterium]
MEHKFETLSTVLNRCSAKVADQVIAEIRAAINDAQQGNDQPAADLSNLETAVHTAKAEQAAARRAKAAERRAAKKIAHNESCGEAEAELPAAAHSPSVEDSAEAAGAAEVCAAFTAKMVKYLRQCPERYMLSVLNTYFNLIFTGNLVNTDDDHRFIDNFIYLARLEGLIDHAQQPTAAQAAAFLFDNPALPLPRAERRRLQRLARKTKLRKSA